MNAPKIVGSLVGLVTGLGLLLAASKSALQPEAGSVFQTLCTFPALSQLVLFLMWAASDVGRTLLSAGVVVSTVVSYLFNHRLREARELALAITLTALMLILAAASASSGAHDKKCLEHQNALVHSST